MFARRRMFTFGALVAVALLGPPVASAQPPSVNPVVQKAFVHLEQGPEELRRFVHRTRMIYQLDYVQVIKSYEAARRAQARAAAGEPRVASVASESR
ncbi:hypothetical protein BURK1_00649 [Burkholderiales bacterium]|nr:hypothetical protein BURK1_00649 [Burkholderiales bacterium]